VRATPSGPYRSDYRRHRACAVGADQELSFDARAVFEGEHDAVALLLYAGEAVPQMNRAVVEPARQRVKKIGAVKGVIGGAVARRRLDPIVEFEEFAGLQVPRVDTRRRGADSRNFLANADRAQRLDGLRAGVNRRADLAERRRGLKQLSLYPQG
jgi:hypothetical protein